MADEKEKGTLQEKLVKKAGEAKEGLRLFGGYVRDRGERILVTGAEVLGKGARKVTEDAAYRLGKLAAAYKQGMEDAAKKGDSPKPRSKKPAATRPRVKK